MTMEEERWGLRQVQGSEMMRERERRERRGARSGETERERGGGV